MPLELLLASHNAHKAEEIGAILSEGLHVRTLKDIGFDTEIPETAATLEGNALLKARFVHERVGGAVIADDTGLEVDALNGAPGVFSARYAGVGCLSEDNVKLLLQHLEGQDYRRARFRTVMALLLDGQEYTFEGIVEGDILEAAQGLGGFGYDPIFQPMGYPLSFAEMSLKAKGQISHRGRAVAKLGAFLRTHLQNS